MSNSSYVVVKIAANEFIQALVSVMVRDGNPLQRSMSYAPATCTRISGVSASEFAGLQQSSFGIMSSCHM